MAWNDYINKVMSPSSNWWDKKLSDKQRFQLQAPQDPSLLNVAAAVPTPVGDVASGLLAAQDVSKGNYGTAALNAVGMLPFVPSLAGTFIGKGSKMWDALKAKEAVKLEKAGVEPQQIWAKTGTIRGVDGKLRQEISDVGAKITDDVYEGIVKNKRFEGKMGQALSHPELYKAYPDTADIGTGMYAWKTPEGNYEEASRTITAGGPGTTSQKSAALHEIQHDIQGKENFARGGTPTSVSGSGQTKDDQFDWARQAYEESKFGKNSGISDDKLLSELLGTPLKNEPIKNWDVLSKREKLNWLDSGRQMSYRRLAGEAEARLTQRRMNLTPEQRLQYYPYAEGQDVYGLDVPLKELIVRGLLE